MKKKKNDENNNPEKKDDKTEIKNNEKCREYHIEKNLKMIKCKEKKKIMVIN